MRRLVIAEKGSAALRLAVVLSRGTFKRRRLGVTAFEFERDGTPHSVVGLRGHIVELDYPEPLRDWATDLDALLAADPDEWVSEPRIADALRTLAAESEEAVIATDFDREGELIGLEALRIAREANPRLAARRVRFSSLTKWDIEAAFREAAEPDERLAASARAREEIDLMWGAVLTRFLSLACGMRGREFLSVGRVQTPTLALLVEREREIEEFVPRPYWVVTATAQAEPPIRAVHAAERLWRQDEADGVQGRAQLAEDAEVVDVDARLVEAMRPPPFNTTSFLGEATRLGLGAARAMAIAETLYRRGLISYPRTDNTVYPRTLGLRAVVERLLESDVSADAARVLAQPEVHPSRGPVEATDHPPIYPTDAARKSTLRADEWRVYELVARRFLATVAPTAKERDTVIELDLCGEPFFARSRAIVDPGWRAIVGGGPGDPELPAVAPGQRLPVLAVTQERHVSEPPPRYSQGQLLHEMERLGLGTKSTRHDILQKLYERGYVEGRRLQVTAMGRAVVEALEAHGAQVTRPEMTAALERGMDAIALGARTPGEVVAESRRLLADALAGMRAHEAGIAHWVRAAIEGEADVGPCDRCGGRMLMRRTRTGRRFAGCSNFPRCRNARNVPTQGLVVPSAETCERCGSRKVVNVRRGAAHLLCIAPTCSDADLARILGV